MKANKINKDNFDKYLSSSRLPRKLKKQLRKSHEWASYCLVRLTTHSYSCNVLDLIAAGM